MPRRKKKYMLLRGYSGRFIVVEREWYDRKGIAKQRGDRKQWWIVTQSDDLGAMSAMAGLTGKYMKMEVNHTHEDEKGNITNVREWELNNDQPSREG